jgi:hypothetical protein
MSRKDTVMGNEQTRVTRCGEIGEKLFDKYGYSLDPRDIWNILNTKQKKKKGEG